MVKLFSKNSNLCDHNSPTSQTDRRTDRRHAMAIPPLLNVSHSLTPTISLPLSMPAAKQQLKHIITMNNTAYWSQSTFQTHVTVRVVTCATAAAGPADIGEEFCRWKTLECRCRRQRHRWDACMAPLALQTAKSVHITSPPGLPIAKFDAISECCGIYNPQQVLSGNVGSTTIRYM